MKLKVFLISIFFIAWFYAVYSIVYWYCMGTIQENQQYERYSNDTSYKILVEYRNRNKKFLDDIKKGDVLADINSNGIKSKGVFINNNIVLATEHAIKDEPITVNGYSAKILMQDKDKDMTILETLYSSDNFAEIDLNGEPNIDKEYIKGDSGTPIYTKENKLYGILIGKNNNTNKYVILKTKDIYKKINIFLGSYNNR